VPERKIDGISFCVITHKNPTRYFYEQTPIPKLERSKSANSGKHKSCRIDFEPIRNTNDIKYISKLTADANCATQNQWKFFNFDDPAQK